APFDERPVRRQQRVESCVAFTRGLSSDDCGEPVSSSRHGLDIRGPVRVYAEQSAQAGDDLLQAVVADSDILPSSFQQIFLRNDLAGTKHEHQQHVKLTLRERDGLSGTAQAATIRIELERLEREARADRHWQSPRA